MDSPDLHDITILAPAKRRPTAGLAAGATDMADNEFECSVLAKVLAAIVARILSQRRVT